MNSVDDKYPEIPEYLKELLESGQTIDDIFLDKEGNWFHNGEPFVNEKIKSFFSRSVDITADGQYVIHYSSYTYPIRVEDAPYFITGVQFEGFGTFERIFLTLSSGASEELDPNTLFCKNNNALYCRIKKGRLVAKFKRSPSFNILERLEETPDGRYSVRICGVNIDLDIKED
ncbi:MAG TPA: DUF1285 domain-containing protein [Spirochaetota bacterium]|nr:DUF1285 domain-containing protein [Spirochaetota bacterium]